VKLQHVEIEQFMGIQSAAFDVGDGGVQFVGKSRSGKTSMANAVHAALKSKGYGPECIHGDADRWRVLLKFDTATVQAIVRRSGSKEIKVDGLGLGSPQAKLDAIFPELIDPWRLALDKPADRLAKVLAAMPAELASEDLKLWTGEDWDPAEGKHALEVLADVRKHYYEKRAAANKAVKDAEAAYKMADDKARSLVSDAHKGVAVPLLGEEDAPVWAAEKAREALEQRRQQAEAMVKRTEGTRARIAELIREADAIRDAGPMVPPMSEANAAKARYGLASDAVIELEAKLEAARTELRAATKALDDLVDQQGSANESTKREAHKRQQASDLEATLAEATIQSPTAEEFASAEQEVSDAKAHSGLVRSARAALDAHVNVSVMGDEVTEAKAEAKRLNDIVERLDNEAVAELAKRARMPKGLTFVDDDIALDGKPFKVLSESEKVEVCVEVVKRIAPEGKLLRIDRMEGMDPDTREDFIRRAKQGGWQIIGTVVEKGELRIVGIDADDERTEAQAEVAPAKPAPKRVKLVMPEDTK
jgi:hypothetical protein